MATSYRTGIRHVDTAFQKFFAKQAGFPSFKKHKDVSFEYKPGTIKIDGSFLRICAALRSLVVEVQHLYSYQGEVNFTQKLSCESDNLMITFT